MDISYLIHCNRDHAMIAGFNRDMQLVRNADADERRLALRFSVLQESETVRNVR